MPSTVPILVPEGKNLSDLTMGELDAASFHLKADVTDCLSGEIPGKRYAAMIEIAYRWARRTDTSVDRDKFRDYDIDDMRRALRMDEDEEAPDPTVGDSLNGSNGSPSPASSGVSPETSTA